MKWVEGRQGTGYKVLTLFKSSKLNADAYLIYYDKGAYIPYHKDPAPKGYIHNRINIVFKTLDAEGGVYYEDWREVKPLINLGLISIFKIKPSEVRHCVTRLKSGKRFVLSFGWLSKKKRKGN